MSQPIKGDGALAELPTVVTGTEVVEGHFAADGTETDTGQFLKLRDANGKVVSVSAGQLVFNSSFQVLGFTPNADPNPRPVIWPALGLTSTEERLRVCPGGQGCGRPFLGCKLGGERGAACGK